MRILKLMADYECWPLWEASPGRVGNVDPETLPISSTLMDRLHRWASEYDATLVRDDPLRSGFPTPEAEEAFEDEGRRLTGRLAAELGPDFRVILHVPR